MLTGEQVGRLWDLVRAALEAHPILPISDNSVPEGEEPWEEDLSRAVDADTVLPSYKQIERDHNDLLEFLVHYICDRTETEEAE